MRAPCCGAALRFIATLLDLAPAAIWARIVTSRSQQPRTVKSFAQCDTSFRPPPLPISIERHYTWRKQNHGFVVPGAGSSAALISSRPSSVPQLHERDEE